MSEITVRYKTHDKCENCNKYRGSRQICEGDGRLHGHGLVHTIDGGLKWLCDNCNDIVREQWQLAQAKQVISL